MKETSRVLLNGDWSGLQKDWEEHGPWPFGDFGVGVVPTSGAEIALLRQLLPEHPEVRSTEFVERSYATRELLTYRFFVLWVNGQIDIQDAEGLDYVGKCGECGFANHRERTQFLHLRRRQLSKRDLAVTDDWEIVVSGRLVDAWVNAGLTGASFSTVVVDGADSEFRVMTIESDIAGELPSVFYDGPQCGACKRYEKLYPTHPSKELWIPAEALPTSDIATVNAGLERTHNNFKVISNRAYRMLLDNKITGWWVQPIHEE